MMYLIILLLALAGHILAQAIPGLGFGPVYLMQRTSSYLVEYSTIMRAPKAPDTQRGVVAVWPGINTDARPTNLVQTILSGGMVRSLVTPSGRLICTSLWLVLTYVSISSGPFAPAPKLRQISGVHLQVQTLAFAPRNRERAFLLTEAKICTSTVRNQLMSISG
jgi:hypothetical protein